MNIGSFTEPEFLKHAVHLPGHPHHDELLESLEDRVFRDPVIKFRNLSHLTGGSQ